MPKGEIQDAVSITFDGFYLHMLSLSHLQTLSYFIEVLPDLRIQHLSNRLDTRKSCAYHGTVTASIFIAVAFLEAQINETLFDVHQRQIEIPDIAQRERLFSALQARLYERNADRWNCIDKYKFVLSTLERQELAKSTETPARKLTFFRNELVHYDPVLQLDPRGTHHPQKLAQELSKYFTGENPRAGFPDSCLCVEAVNWAYVSARRFSEEFFARLNSPIPYLHLKLVDPATLPLVSPPP